VNFPPRAGLALATFLMAGNFIAGRALRGEIDPLAMNFWRWLIAFVALAPFLAASAVKHGPLLRRHAGFVATLGLTGFVVPHTCNYFALQTTTAVNALLLMNLVPLGVTLGAAALYGQPVRPAQWLGLGVSLLGAAGLIVRFDPQVLRSLQLTPGDLWMLPAAASVALHILLLRRTPAGLPQGPLLLGSAFAAVLLMLPGMLLGGAGQWQVPAHAWPSLLYIGIGASAIAFVLWNRGVAEVGPQRAAPFMYLMPLYGSLLSVLLLAESPQPYQLAGAALVLSGLWLAGRAAPLPRAAAA